MIQTPTDIILFCGNSDCGGGNYEYRDIPTDGRARAETVEAY